MKFVIYRPETGAIRAIVTGSRAIAESNTREGEAVAEHRGYVHPTKHRVEAGAVVPI